MSNNGPMKVQSLINRFQTGQANNASGAFTVDVSADEALAKEAHERALRDQQNVQEDNFEQIFNEQMARLKDVDLALAATEKVMTQQQSGPKSAAAIVTLFDEDKYAKASQSGLELEQALEAANQKFGLS